MMVDSSTTLGHLVDVSTKVGIMTEQLAAAARDAWTGYRRMSVRLTDAMNRELAEATGLSQADFEVLVVLMEHPDESIRDITLRCGLAWEKSRLSHQLRRMEGRGLVTRGACAEDNRSSTVSLTDAGRHAARRGQEVETAFIARHLGDVLPTEQLEQLSAAATAILGALGPPRH